MRQGGERSSKGGGSSSPSGFPTSERVLGSSSETPSVKQLTHCAGVGDEERTAASGGEAQRFVDELCLSALTSPSVFIQYAGIGVVGHRAKAAGRFESVLKSGECYQLGSNPRCQQLIIEFRNKTGVGCAAQLQPAGVGKETTHIPGDRKIHEIAFWVDKGRNQFKALQSRTASRLYRRLGIRHVRLELTHQYSLQALQKRRTVSSPSSPPLGVSSGFDSRLLCLDLEAEDAQLVALGLKQKRAVIVASGSIFNLRVYDQVHPNCFGKISSFTLASGAVEKDRVATEPFHGGPRSPVAQPRSPRGQTASKRESMARGGCSSTCSLQLVASNGNAESIIGELNIGPVWFESRMQASISRRGNVGSRSQSRIGGPLHARTFGASTRRVKPRLDATDCAAALANPPNYQTKGLAVRRSRVKSFQGPPGSTFGPQPRVSVGPYPKTPPGPLRTPLFLDQL